MYLFLPAHSCCAIVYSHYAITDSETVDPISKDI